MTTRQGNPYNRQPLPRTCNHIEYNDWSAEYYMTGESHRIDQHEIDGYQRAVALARIPATAQVLDIACGIGIIGKIIGSTRSENFDDIFFAHAADDMLGYVQRDVANITGGHDHDHHVARCDLRDPEAMETLTRQFSRSTHFHSATGFDYVFAINILHHMAEETQAKAINQIFSFVKPGGFLIIDYLARQKSDKRFVFGPMVRTCHLMSGDLSAAIRPIAAAHCVGPEQLHYLSSSFAALVERVGAGDLVRKEERHSRGDETGVKWVNLTSEYDATYRASTLPTAEERHDAAIKQVLRPLFWRLDFANMDKYTAYLSFGYNAVFKKA